VTIYAIVAMSSRGEQLAASARTARSSEAEAFFGRLSDDDREALSRILRALRS
jgi:hypothetical protein